LVFIGSAVALDNCHFLFAAVRNLNDAFALRFLIGSLESSFTVGVITTMGNWCKRQGIYSLPHPIHTKSFDNYSELAKRIAIFYSAIYATGIFSGYLKVDIYPRLDGQLRFAGWRWLLIFSGIISLPPLFSNYTQLQILYAF